MAGGDGRRSFVRRFLGLFVSAGAIAAIVWWATKQPAPALPRSAGHLLQLVAALGVYAVATVVRAWRWHVILRLEGIDHQRREALGLVVVGYMGNTVLPARGGEVLRVLLLGQRSGARKVQILGSIVAERLLDAVVLAALFAVLTWLSVAGAPAGQWPAILAAAGVAGIIVGGALYLRLRARGRFQRLADRLRPLIHASRPLLSPTGVMLAGATAGVWLLEGVVFALVAGSLGLDISVIEGLYLDVLASFFALIPAAPGYVGTMDAAMLFGLTALDVTGGDAVAFVLLVRFVLFVPITLAGGILMLTRYGGLSQLRRSRRAP